MTIPSGWDALLAQLFPSLGVRVTSDAGTEMSRLVTNLDSRLYAIAMRITGYVVPIDVDDILGAATQLIPFQIQELALPRAARALVVYDRDPARFNTLFFVIPWRLLQRPLMTDRAAVFLAGIVDFVASEILQLAGNRVLERRGRTIGLPDVIRAVADDGELNHLYNE